MKQCSGVRSKAPVDTVQVFKSLCNELEANTKCCVCGPPHLVPVLGQLGGPIVLDDVLEVGGHCDAVARGEWDSECVLKMFWMQVRLSVVGKNRVA